MEKARFPYYIGLDLGTDSVGYAVTDDRYGLLKFRSKLMWGVHHFEEALLSDERRSFRTARRRLDRRQQRVKLVQELFAKEIAQTDSHFFIRIKESALYPEDTSFGAYLFGGAAADKAYHEKYPTIHHLISDLIHSEQPHDVRLVYLAVAWLVAHRGHFLNEITKDNMSEVLDIENVYGDFLAFFGEDAPWSCSDLTAFGEILKKKIGVNAKYKSLCALLFGATKAPKQTDSTYDREMLLKMLCGGKVSPKQLFCNEEYADVDSFTLDKGDDELAPILAALGEDSELILKAKALYDWAVLSDILQGEKYLSDAKIAVYKQHKADLANLKYLFRKYLPNKYNEMFRNNGKANYAAYSAHYKGADRNRHEEKNVKHEAFCDYTKKLIKSIEAQTKDVSLLEDMIARLENYTFCPKQVNSDNRVIPYQVYWVELKAILDRAESYLPFLRASCDGSTVSEKILSVFEFRIPYFVGPINSASKRAWMVRRAEGKIYPWNFDEKVDADASEQAFIDAMTNTCTYIPDADVLPKKSLCYEKFELLNELNAISVNGMRISVEAKQRLFSELCMNRKRVTKKAIKDFLRVNNYYTAQELDTLSGIDDTVKSTLYSHMSLRNLLESGQLSESDAERIICRRTYTESGHRFALWLSREYPQLSEKDRKYICTLKFKDFGRLSRQLLEFYGTEADMQTDEAFSILERMWNENVLLMELLSNRYTYGKEIENLRSEYFLNHPKSLDERLADLYVSNAVKRSILRALDVVSDVVKANGGAPEKIFVEMARGAKPEEKGNRTKSRYEQIVELYKKCKTEDIRHLSESLSQIGDSGKLQSDRLFLYYMQLGRCMYTGEPIDIQRLSDKSYDIDHIYPQSKVKDDSVLNNKVLVLSTANADKGDVYPIKAEIRHKMQPCWKFLLDSGLITEEKYKRLTRNMPFSETEQWGFINRQLVETRQSTKALATILDELYPETKIVYVKAGLVSEFRQEFDMLKSRAVNDLHHAKDAYLNIVVGNVYNERFTRQWFMAHRDEYNLKVKTLFAHTVKGADGQLVWQGASDIAKIKNLVHNKNAVNQT